MESQAQEAQVTSRDLLQAFLDLRRLAPELDTWTEERLADNPPRLARLQQLVALFRAFGIPWDPVAFVDGTFIRPEDPRYDAILSRLKAEAVDGEKLEDRRARRQLPRFFSILFDYRTRLDDVLSFNSGVIEASGLYLLAHRKADMQNQIIRNNLAAIEDTLTELISPAGAAFPRERLVREFGYPDVDVTDLDLDWL
jgi:hypothetical protein